MGTTTLKERMDQMKGEIAKQRRQATTAAATIAILGVVILVGLSVYFYMGYKAANTIKEPKYLLDYAELQIKDNLDPMLTSLENQVVQQAPDWAASLSKQAVAQIPGWRGQVETWALGQYDQGVEKVTNMTSDHFREFIRSHKPMLERKYKELAESEALTDKSLSELESNLAGNIEGDMKGQAAELFKSLKAMNLNMRRLKEGKNLTEGEQLERRLISIARRLYLEQLDPTKVKTSPITDADKPIKKAAPANTPAKKTETKGSTKETKKG
jgi:hypothetical protein